jgi:alcohol dehydrogenase
VSDSETWSHHNPVRIICAPLENLANYITAQHVLLVTTPGFVKRGVVQRVKNILESRQVTIWDRVKPNPDLQDLDIAIKYLRECGIGCVIGLGGGSALDMAKVLATTIASPVEPTLRQVFRDKAMTRWAPRLPLIAIPTTSGTGAEVTPFATLWDHEECQKYSLTGDFVYPDLALLDVTLTMTLGEEDTLYPALDSISHALESLWNKNSTPITRAFAFKSLALSNDALPIVMKEPHNIKARRNLQTASLLAGFAISQTRTAIAHSISYGFTSRFGVPHGLACSFSLKKIIELNLNKLDINNEEIKIITILMKLLKELDLTERLSKYVSLEKMLSDTCFQLDNQRAKNYSGNQLDMKTIFQKILDEKK